MFSFSAHIILLVVLAFLFAKIFRRLGRIEKEIGLYEEVTASDEVDEYEEETARQLAEAAVEQTKENGGKGEREEVEVDGEQAKTEVKKESAPTPPSENSFVAWLTENWLMKLGALLVLIAVGWFVTYAFMQGWIGPHGRITLGLVFGALVMVGGKVRAKSHVDQGGVLLVLGSTAVLLTMFAARFVYEFFTPLTAMGVMLLSVGFVALASVLHKSRWLSFSSLVLACIVPLLTAGQPGVVGVMVYLAVVVVGTTWVVAFTNWRNLTLGSLIATALYSLQYISPTTSPDQQTALIFVFGFVAFFAVMNVVSFIREKYEDLSVADLIIAVGNGVFLLGWVMQAVSAEWQSLTLVVWTLAFAVGSFAVYRLSDNPAPFFAYSGVAGGFVAAATAVELSGAVLTMAYTVEVSLLLLLVGVLTGKHRVIRFVSFLYAAPVIMSFDSLVDPSWSTGVFHTDFAVLLMMMVVFAVSAYAIGSPSQAPDEANNESITLRNIYALLTTFYATALVWLVTHAIPAISGELATGISLGIYTIAGILFYVVGKKLKQKMVRYLGLIFVWGVVARLVFVEVWAMSLVGKVITFFMVGGLFMGTAFLEQGDDNDVNN